MSTKQLFVIAFILLSFSSCRTGSNQENARKAVTKQISGTEMAACNLEGYGIVGLHGNYLFLKENRDTSRLVVYHIEIEGDSLTRFKGLINKGRGPREFYYPEYAFTRDSLFISNSDPGGMRAIYGISLRDMRNIDNVQAWSEYTFHETDLMTGLSFVPLGAGKFVIAAGTAGTRQIFSLTDFGKGERVPLLFWPNDSTAGPLHCKQMVYMQSKLRARGEKILYANLNARYLFIGTVRDNQLSVNSVIYSHLPQYQVKADENIRYLENGEYGILPYTTEKFIYAQVGRTVREVKQSDSYKGYPVLYCDEIEVYDWDGTFIDNYQTDRPFYSFAVTPDNKTLYTMSQDTLSKEPVIVRYALAH